MQIAIIETGGTINGILAPGDSAPQDSRVVDYLTAHASRLHIEIAEVHRICMKDSRAITDADREALVDAVEATQSPGILIPHGTFTMAETGSYLERQLQNTGRKTIVLVGSNLPLGEEGSDAVENIEFALQSMTTQGPGVWVAMSGKAWKPNCVRKNLDTGEFVSK